MDAILDDKDGVLLVMLDRLLDPSAAFNALDHDVLLNRLEDSVSVKAAAIRWL